MTDLLPASPTLVNADPFAPSGRTFAWLRAMLIVLGRAFTSALGFATAVPLLAVLSAIPVLNLLSLGYLLEAAARVAKSGRFRDGFIGLPQFAVVGMMILATWIWSIPIRLIYSFLQDAELIDAGGPIATRLRILLIVMFLAIILHLVWACLRGAKWYHFLWPAPLRLLRVLGETWYFQPILENILKFLREMRLPHFFRLGALGFLGAAIWLALPVMILLFGSAIANPAAAALVSLIGAILLATVVLYLPFLQTRFAESGKWGDFFAIRKVRELFSNAPLAFWMALFVTLLFSLPLYLLKIELTPKEVAWLPNLFFVLFIFPARILTGWSLSRARLQATTRSWVARWAARLAAIPVVAVYAFVVWLTQYLDWNGALGLIEQHAFLVPAPLLGL